MEDVDQVEELKDAALLIGVALLAGFGVAVALAILVIKWWLS
jgi:hypothetical protein